MAVPLSLRGTPAGRASWAARTIVAVIAAAFCAPGAIVLWRAARLGGSISSVLAELVGPAWRSAVLTVLVSATCAVVGTALAWLVTLTDLPGRRWWRVVLVLPLVWPSFVGATAVLSGLTPGGSLSAVLGWFGVDAQPRRGLLPAWVMLSAFSYPYVMIPVMARLQALRPSLDETARLLGLGPVQVFWRVTLPHVRPAVVGGTLICALYMMSEFGAVQLFGYDTLTRVIYATRQTDRATSFIAAAILFVAAIALVTGVRWTQRRIPLDDRSGVHTPRPVGLNAAARALALGVCVAVAAVGVVAPLVGLGGWAWRGIGERHGTRRSLRCSLRLSRSPRSGRSPG
jgi:iron(III) transport system permease protein